MFKKVNILDEKEKILHEISDEVEGKLSDKEIDLIKRSLKQLRFSQIEELSLKYNLRPGMGLAFPQLGIKKRVIMICHEEEPGKFNDYVVINPKIVSNSTEMIAADAGEGCLSVNREVEGHVPRFARVTIEGYDIEGNKIGIIIDRIARVVPVQGDEIKPPPQMLSGIGTEYIHGVVRQENNYLIILDTRKLFSAKELQKILEPEAV